MTLETGSSVRNLVELLADNDELIPVNSRGTVVGYAGERVVVVFRDEEHDETRSAQAEIWEVRP